MRQQRSMWPALAVLLLLCPWASAQVTFKIGHATTRSFFGTAQLNAFETEVTFQAALDYYSSLDPRFKFELVLQDVSPATGMPFATTCRIAGEYFGRSDVIGVVGPTFSSCAIHIAPAVGVYNLSIISGTATAVVLSNKTLYPTFFRIPPPDDLQGVVAAGFLDICPGWKNIGIIAVADTYGTGLAQSFAAALRRRNVTDVTTVWVVSGQPLRNVTEVVRPLREKGYTVNFLSCASGDVINILQAAYSLGMVGPEYVWIAPDGVVQYSVSEIDRALYNAFHGMVGTAPLNQGPALQAVLEFEGPSQFSTYVTRYRVPQTSPLNIDSASALYHAVSRTFDRYNASDLQGYRGIILEELRKFDSFANGFVAASNPQGMYFDAQQNGPPQYAVRNLVNGMWVTLGTSFMETTTLQSPVIWHDGSNVCPSGALSPPVETASTSSSNGFSWYIGLIIALSAALFITIAILLIMRQRHRQKLQPHDFVPQLVNFKDPKIPREIERKCVTLLGEIGEGYFGQVMKGQLDESMFGGVPSYPVAVKICRDSATSADVDAMLAEAAIMYQYSHHENVVSMIGVVTKGMPIMLILQYCEYGSLLQYMRTRFKNGHELSLASKLKMALEVASGMAHIHALNGIHRDLAARNILVAADFTCKVSDFGMARHDIYQQQGYRMVPIKWTAPEALLRGAYTTKCDVWSYGVLLTEIVTNGEEPYPDMSNEAVRIAITESDYRMPRMAACPRSLYALIRTCWLADPDQRPTFVMLRKSILKLTRTTSRMALSMGTMIDSDLQGSNEGVNRSLSGDIDLEATEGDVLSLTGRSKLYGKHGGSGKTAPSKPKRPVKMGRRRARSDGPQLVHYSVSPNGEVLGSIGPTLVPMSEFDETILDEDLSDNEDEEVREATEGDEGQAASAAAATAGFGAEASSTVAAATAAKTESPSPNREQERSLVERNTFANGLNSSGVFSRLASTNADQQQQDQRQKRPPARVDKSLGPAGETAVVEPDDGHGNSVPLQTLNSLQLQSPLQPDHALEEDTMDDDVFEAPAPSAALPSALTGGAASNGDSYPLIRSALVYPRSTSEPAKVNGHDDRRAARANKPLHVSYLPGEVQARPGQPSSSGAKSSSPARGSLSSKNGLPPKGSLPSKNGNGSLSSGVASSNGHGQSRSRGGSGTTSPSADPRRLEEGHPAMSASLSSLTTAANANAGPKLYPASKGYEKTLTLSTVQSTTSPYSQTLCLSALPAEEEHVHVDVSLV